MGKSWFRFTLEKRFCKAVLLKLYFSLLHRGHFTNDGRSSRAAHRLRADIVTDLVVSTDIYSRLTSAANTEDLVLIFCEDLLSGDVCWRKVRPDASTEYRIPPGSITNSKLVCHFVSSVH